MMMFFDYLLSVRHNDGVVLFYLGGVKYWVTTSGTFNLYDGNWHNLVATYDTANQTIYIDGNFVSSTNANGSITSSLNNVAIGGSSSFFKGSMDNVKIYNKALTANEIQDRYNKVKLYYSPNYKFDGVNDYINVKNSSSLNINNNPISVSAWVYWKSSTEPYNSIIAKEIPGDNAGYSLSLKSNQKLAWQLCNSGGSCIDVDGLGGNVGFNDWHYVVGVYDGSNMFTYIDGNLDYSKPESLAWGGHDAGDLRIGGNSFFGSGRYFNGSITNVQVYNYALSANQINQIYNSYLSGGQSPDITYDQKTYYLSSSIGDDLNDGLSPESPWRSLEKIFIEQSIPGKIIPGDSILLKRGDIWEETSCVVLHDRRMA